MASKGRNELITDPIFRESTLYNGWLCYALFDHFVSAAKAGLISLQYKFEHFCLLEILEINNLTVSVNVGIQSWFN